MIDYLYASRGLRSPAEEIVDLSHPSENCSNECRDNHWPAMDNKNSVVTKNVTIVQREVYSAHGDERPFFPFEEDTERHRMHLDRRDAAFPALGLGALAAANFLIILSAVILFVIGGPGRVVSDWTVHVWHTHHYVTIPKPAAWLSAILSFISVAFHIAISEGLNIAWWYKVRKDDVTVRDLHQTWDHGTSSWSAFKSGGSDLKTGILHLHRRLTGKAEESPVKKARFSYVALATLFVATVPLNGFLLQSAVVVESTTVPKNGTISLPMMTGDNLGQTGIGGTYYDPGHALWSPSLGLISQNTSPKLPATTDLKSFNTTCPETCNAVIPGAGFQISCTETTLPYNISGDPENGNYGSEEMQTTGADIFSVQVSFDFAKPNRISTKTYSKSDFHCVGDYSVHTCTLDLATVTYPVTINSGVQEMTSSGLRNSTVMSLDLDLLNARPHVIDVLPLSPYEGRRQRRQGYATGIPGIADFFAATFNSSINLLYTQDTLTNLNQIRAEGLFAQQQLYTNSNFSTNSGGPLPCQNTFGSPQNSVNAELLAEMQSMMFQLSVYTNLNPANSPQYDGSFYLQNVTATQTFKQNQYRIVWPWYFGSLTVTLLVTLAVTPTFWGFWMLERKTTMSPFETARAFHAPMLYQNDSRIRSEELMKKVGDVNIHKDLGVKSSRPGTGKEEPGTGSSLR